MPCSECTASQRGYLVHTASGSSGLQWRGGEGEREGGREGEREGEGETGGLIICMFDKFSLLAHTAAALMFTRVIVHW